MTSSRSSHVCPWWGGYLLLLPLRRLRQSPRKWLGPLVHEGMTVLEPGPGMGYFTLDLARMVGPAGRVVAVDIQEKMIASLRRRAERSGLSDRIELRLARDGDMGIGDLAGRVDLVAALYVVHEMPDPGFFFAQAYRALRPGGRLLFVEPRMHVPRADFDRFVALAGRAGLAHAGDAPFSGPHAVVLMRPGSP